MLIIGIKVFKEHQKTVSEAEYFRSTLSSKWLQLMIFCGAIVLRTPSFDSCVTGFYLKLALNYSKNLKIWESIEIQDKKEPYLDFNILLNEEDISIQDEINSFIDYMLHSSGLILKTLEQLINARKSLLNFAKGLKQLKSLKLTKTQE